MNGETALYRKQCAKDMIDLLMRTAFEVDTEWQPLAGTTQPNLHQDPHPATGTNLASSRIHGFLKVSPAAEDSLLAPPPRASSGGAKAALMVVDVAVVAMLGLLIFCPNSSCAG
jgi:hypothetical protein